MTSEKRKATGGRI